MNIYLDNASTTPLSNSMKEYLTSLLNEYGNPSSTHYIGEKARNIIAESRLKIASFINANVDNIYFTCSGSASNTLGIKGFIQKNNYNVFYSPIAHKSILKIMENINSTSLKVDEHGYIDINDMENSIMGRKPFLIIDYANSEIGTIQDIKSIIEIVHFYKGIVYLDCTGSIPTIPLNVKYLDVDMCGFSAHKLGGLKGCGVLYKKKNINLDPLIYGTQEKGLIGGTENVLGIASLGKAVEEYNYSSISSYSRDYVYNYITDNIPDSYLIGATIESGNRLPHNLYMCFKNIMGESLMILLDMNEIQVSTGSACSSGIQSVSTTLSAINMNDNDMRSCVRMSFSGKETEQELIYVCENLKKGVQALRDINNEL